MALPKFTESGDIPPGVHEASLAEVVDRFSRPEGPRHLCTQRLTRIYTLAQRTGSMQRFLIFGSYITTKPDPNDVDVILVMEDTFQLETCPADIQRLFDHAVAQVRYGASIFWVRPSLLISEDMETFIAS